MLAVRRTPPWSRAGHRVRRLGRDRDLGEFALAAFVGALPFWLAGAHAARLPAPFDALPVTALGAAVPATTAVWVARREGSLPGLKARLTSRPPHPGCWLAAAGAFSVPTLVDALLRGGEWPRQNGGGLVLQGAAYLVAALGEELGWTTFALPRLLGTTRSVPGAAAASCAYWTSWHLVPFAQTGNDAAWVAAQSMQTVLMRCTIVGLSAGAGEFAWLAVVLHATSNLAWAFSPPGYRPLVVDMLALPVAAGALAWGARRWRPAGGADRPTRQPPAHDRGGEGR